MNCPKCHSEDWKLASVIYNQGLTDVNTSTSGGTLGAGVGTGGINVGYARSSSETTGEHQTTFSKQAAPPDVPPKPKLLHSTNAVAVVQFLGLGIGLYLIFKENILLGFVALALLIGFWSKITNALKSNRDGEHKDYEAKHAKEIEEYKHAVEAYKKWETAAICLRCGDLFYPNINSHNI